MLVFPVVNTLESAVQSRRDVLLPCFTEQSESFPSSSPGHRDRSENAFTLTLLTAPEEPRRGGVEARRVPPAAPQLCEKRPPRPTSAGSDLRRRSTGKTRFIAFSPLPMSTDRSQAGTTGSRGQGLFFFLVKILSK